MQLSQITIDIAKFLDISGTIFQEFIDIGLKWKDSFPTATFIV